MGDIELLKKVCFLSCFKILREANTITCSSGEYGFSESYNSPRQALIGVYTYMKNNRLGIYDSSSNVSNFSMREMEYLEHLSVGSSVLSHTVCN